MADRCSLDAVPVLSRLRAETRDLHASAESTLSISDGDLGAAAYTTVLERWYGFLAVLEPRLTTWHRAHHVLDWERRGKLLLLEADLDVLGTDRLARWWLPRCPHIPGIEGTATRCFDPSITKTG